MLYRLLQLGLIISYLGLTACGNSGALYLPHHQASLVQGIGKPRVAANQSAFTDKSQQN